MDDTYSTNGHIPGTVLLDGFLQSFAQGIILTQYVKYWADYRDDSWQKRAFVAVVNLLVILQTVLEDIKVWRLSLNDERWWMNNMQWSDFLINGLICSMCEAFFVQRCWKITNRNYYFLLPLFILTLTILVADIVLAISVQKVGRAVVPGQDTLKISRDLYPSTIVAFTFWTFGSLVLNITITIILISRLWKARIGLTDSDKVLYNVMTITWESAAAPSLSMLIAVTIYHASLDSNYHLVRLFVLTTGKLYTIGLLRTLNSRIELRERMQSHDLGRVSLGGWRMPGSQSVGGLSTTQVT